jgi:hypothetical protein
MDLGDHEEDAYMERLAKQRANRRRGRPLVDLYSELATGSHALQVHALELQTAPPRRTGTVAQEFRIKRRDPSLRDPDEVTARCRHEGVDEFPFDEF